MTQTKFFQLAAIAVACVWVFCLTLTVSVKVSRMRDEQTTAPTPMTQAQAGQANANASQAAWADTTTSAIAPTTIPVPGAADTTQAPVTAITDLTTAAPAVTDITTADKETQIKAYVDAINNLKSGGNYTMKKKDTLDVNIISLSPGGSTVQGIANSVISSNPPDDITYTFQNGTDAATGKTPMAAIAPLGVNAKVDPNAVTNISTVKNADGGYTITMTIQPETQTLTTPAPNISTMVEAIDVQGLIPSGAELTNLTINYGATTIKATFDSQNRLMETEHFLSVTEANGTGKVLLLSINATLGGEFTSKYTFTYN